MNKDIRVILIDDQELVRYGLRHMLEQEEDIEVVGDFANTEEALSRTANLRPDIILIDIQMLKKDGNIASHHLERIGLHCDAKLIILAEHTDKLAYEAMEGRTDTYLIKKDIKLAEFAQTIRQVYYNKRSVEEEHGGHAEEAIQLVINTPANSALLLGYICQLDRRLQDDCHYYHASITHIVGSRDRDTAILVTLGNRSVASFLDELRDMPEVERVEEETLAEGALSGFVKKLRGPLILSTNPGKMARITLRETVSTKREPIAVLN